MWRKEGEAAAERGGEKGGIEWRCLILGCIEQGGPWCGGRRGRQLLKGGGRGGLSGAA